MGLATGLAIGGLVVSAASATSSFVQAGKQRKKQEEAERAAGKAMEEAKSKLQTNFYEGLSIQKEAYDLEREAALTGLGQIVQAGQEGEQRGAAVTAGKAALFNQAQQAQTRTAMSKEMQDLEKLAASEESRLRDARANIDLGEAAGQQRIAADARAARQAANQAGVSSLMSMGQQAMKLPGLYGSGSSISQFDPSNKSFEQTQSKFNPSNTARFFGADLPSVSNIQEQQYDFGTIFPQAEAITIPAITLPPPPNN